ncbi:TetR/AcrR family transcriptional regulator [Pseudochelatococcus lubricantis]|uniref:TetR/AcrR family transcriptional regulator n=1 Tax=Pseudochelatococcus lubricantis TaxID=1538102 RepID=UPI0035E611A9
MLRQDLAEAAFDAVIANGYGQSIEDIAAAIGISRATFFRYFGTKEDIVIAAMLGPVDIFAAAYTETSGSIWLRLRGAIQPVIERIEAEPDRMRARFQLVQSLPQLHAGLRKARQPQIEALAAMIEREGADPLGAHVFAVAAIAVLDQCWALWANGQQGAITDALDRAYAHLSDGDLKLRPPGQ